ncbi:remorin 4.1-like [Phragmites australis]|uniref:remorin 4.1-like n=1 Tax=Phragmites australis TaxID=29695 RepID=UPI002D79EB98|nr:remorin 4.1-like [Phragmites australis]
MGVMSPTKLRVKLLGSHGGGKKEEASGKSPRASPSRLVVDDGADHPKSSLLAQELDEEYPRDRSDSSRSRSDASHGRAAHSGGGSGCDSGHENGSPGTGAGGSNFEFHREVRGAVVSGPFFRQVPSKWNDAEKWIAGRHVVHSNPIFSKKPAALPHAPAGGGRVAPESAAPKGGTPCDNPSSRGGGAASALTELSSKSSSPSSVSGPVNNPPHKRLRAAALPPAQPVSMRDVGTETTPIASQEQSRSSTPAGAATPSLSPLCSVPSSPRGGASASSSSASERELRLRTRREIAALGLQLGKMNIASWASNEGGLLARAASPAESPGAIDDEIKRKELEARAAAWEESHKCKLASRYQRKEVKIQEWESCQKSKFEAKMRQAEAQAEQMRARAKHNLAKRLSVLSHRVEVKQARVEARRSRQAARLARQVERIRKTGREPCRFRRCCSWFL